MQIIIDIILFLILLIIFLSLIVYTWRFYSMYAGQKFLNGLDFVMFEIKLPREIYKSPEAMEIVANSFLQGGGVSTKFNRMWQGKVPTFFSLEIVSLEGDIKFLVRCEKKYSQLVKNNFYSQYPGIQMIEVEDYVSRIFYEHRTSTVSLFGMTHKPSETFHLYNNLKGDRKDYYANSVDNQKDEKKKKEAKDKLKMPSDFKMLKTYIDFRQDRDPKEEFEHDPLTPILEWLGSMKAGEYGYYQLILQDAGKFNGEAFAKTYHNEATHESFTLKELADERRKELRVKIVEGHKAGDIVYDEYGNAKKKRVKIKYKDGEVEKEKEEEVDLTYGKDIDPKHESFKDSDLNFETQEELKMINRKLAKPVLRATLRVMYIAKKDIFNASQNVQSLLSMFKQYTAPGYNSFAPSTTDPYDFDWQDTMKRRRPMRGEEFFESYVEREAFYPHIKDRAEAGNWFMEMLFGWGIDSWLDIYMFDKDFGYRKIFRLMYEGFLHPFEHPHPNTVFTLNLEEVASLWHLPGTVATTPGIKRIDSLMSQAPDNLPR